MRNNKRNLDASTFTSDNLITTKMIIVETCKTYFSTLLRKLSVLLFQTVYFHFSLLSSHDSADSHKLHDIMHSLSRFCTYKTSETTKTFLVMNFAFIFPSLRDSDLGSWPLFLCALKLFYIIMSLAWKSDRAAV